MIRGGLEYASEGPKPPGKGWVKAESGWVRRAPTPRYLTLREVAEVFGVHRSTIRRWYLAGWLPEPITGPNGTWRWREDELEPDKMRERAAQAQLQQGVTWGGPLGRKAKGGDHA